MNQVYVRTSRLLSILGMLALCTTAFSQQAGGTLRIGIARMPFSLDSHLETGRIGQPLLQVVMNSMLTLDEAGDPIPALAESYDQPDETTYVFHLREGVTFHDGTTLTADDVVYSWTRMLDPTYSYNAAKYQGLVADITKVDDYTVQLDLQKPWYGLIYELAAEKSWHILSQEAVEGAGESYGRDVLVGTGPFRFVEWVSDQRIVLERNPDYWGTEAFLDRIEYVLIPEESVRLLALEVGELDVIYDFASYQEIERLETEPGIDVQSFDSGIIVLFDPNTRVAPFDSKQVRQAIHLAIDKQMLADVLFYGNATVANDLFPPYVWAHDPDFVPYAYNSERALELLAEAGYGPSNPLRFTIMVQPSADVPFVELAELIQAQLESIGVQMNIERAEASTIIDYIHGRNNRNPADYQGRIGAYGFNRHIDNWVYRMYSYTSSLNRSWYNKEGGYQNDWARDAIEEVISILDEEEARALYREIAAAILDDSPVIPLLYPRNINVKRTYVMDLPITEFDQQPLHQVWLDR